MCLGQKMLNFTTGYRTWMNCMLPFWEPGIRKTPIKISTASPRTITLIYYLTGCVVFYNAGVGATYNTPRALHNCRCRVADFVAKSLKGLQNRQERDTDPRGNLEASKPRCTGERETPAYLAASLHFTVDGSRSRYFSWLSQFNRSRVDSPP